MSTVKWVTKDGKTTSRQRQATSALEKIFTGIRSEFGIRRFIPLLVVDEESWSNKQGLNMNRNSVAHYNKGIKFRGGKPFEAVLLRAAVLNWPDADTAVPKILRHELVHAKLKGKEKGNEHAAAFSKAAKKYKNVAKRGDY